MELKLDKTTKILLGAIAFGLFLNAIPVVKADFSYDDSKLLKAFVDIVYDTQTEMFFGKPVRVECVKGC